MYLVNIITLKVLSERPIDNLELKDILWECDEGDCVLSSIDFAVTQIDAARMATELVLAGSDPSFFDITDEDEDE